MKAHIWIVMMVACLASGEALAQQSKRQAKRYRNPGSIWDRQTEPNRFWPQRWKSAGGRRRVPRLRTPRQLRRRRYSNGVPLFRCQTWRRPHRRTKRRRRGG